MKSHDFLSYVLSSLRVHSSAIFIFDLREPWAIRIHDVITPISLTVMERGFWLMSPDGPPIEVRQGDTILLPHGVNGKPYTLASSPDVKPTDVVDLFRGVDIERYEPGSVVDRPMYVHAGGSGPLTRIVSAAFGFDIRRLDPLMAALPEVMTVRAADGDPELVDLLLRSLIKADIEQPGFLALVAQTAQLLLVHVVRTYALKVSETEISWLAGMADKRIARALMAIYQEPEKEWDVALLARRAGLSRSGFAKLFLTRLGKTPMQYLRTWRMQLAQEALMSGDVTVTVLARNLGYQSEAAFREAFREATGHTPRLFRKQNRAGSR